MVIGCDGRLLLYQYCFLMHVYTILDATEKRLYKEIIKRLPKAWMLKRYYKDSGEFLGLNTVSSESRRKKIKSRRVAALMFLTDIFSTVHVYNSA